MEILSKKEKPKRSLAYDTYWKFAAERQSIFFRRVDGSGPPWTKDPVLNTFKFTNAYRATDRVSQFLIRKVIADGDQRPKELLFRILIFKVFNKISTWELLVKNLGEVRYESYDFAVYDRILSQALLHRHPIYSAAYIMASGLEAFGYPRKHQNHLKLIQSIIEQGLIEDAGSFNSMESLYKALLQYPTIGPFLAYQYSTDINYSMLCDFSEMEFVKAGPGALDGIRKCFTDQGGYSPEDIIRMMANSQEEEFNRLGIRFQNLWGRPLQLIDCQNIFCEVDKYLRVTRPEIAGGSGRKKIKQKFRPTSLKPIEYVLPLKWKERPLSND